MKFYNYIKDVNITLTKDDDLTDILDESVSDDIKKVIDDLNESLRLTKNKKKFRLSLSKDIPVLKSKNEEKVVTQWLKANEELTHIKKSFLEYMNNLTF